MRTRNIQKYFGPPGTGKTTTLLQLVEDHLQNGIQPDKMAFISYSVKAAAEAKNRASISIGLGFDEMPYFCTSHAFCKRVMGMGRVLSGDDIVDFLREYSFNLTKNYSMETRKSVESLVDDPYFQIIEAAKVNMRTLEEERLNSEIGLRRDVVPAILHAIAEAWERYREESSPKIYSFADMITQFIESGEVPPLDVLIVDEAQDLAELNWQLVDKLSAEVDVTYIAGDDDQAIYEWNGARPERLINYQGKKIVLDQSYRIPKSVHELADKISKRISVREDKDYKPRKEQGEVLDIASTDLLPLEEGNWLVLASCDYMLSDSNKGYGIRKHLINNGYPFSHNHFRYIPHKMINAIDTWEQVLDDKEVTVGQLGDLYQFLGKDSVKRGFISRVQADPNKAQKVDKQGMIDNYGLIPDCLDKDWQEVFNRSIDVQRRAFIEKAITNKEDLHGEPRIAISTIHQAKGGEADNVAVLLDLSPSQKKYSMLKPDGLHRQFYVAVTRALERLYLVKARNDYYRYII